MRLAHLIAMLATWLQPYLIPIPYALPIGYLALALFLHLMNLTSLSPITMGPRTVLFFALCSSILVMVSSYFLKRTLLARALHRLSLVTVVVSLLPTSSLLT